MKLSTLHFDRDIYRMKLHDILITHLGSQGYQILRVPGGWMYTRHESEDHTVVSSSSIFVPFIKFIEDASLKERR